jgi:hypothetical protein
MLQQTIGNQAVQRLLRVRLANPAQRTASVQRAVARAATGGPTREEPAVFIAPAKRP